SRAARRTPIDSPAPRAGAKAAAQDLELSSRAAEGGRRRATGRHDSRAKPRRHRDALAVAAKGRAPEGASNRTDWPSAREILAMHRAIPPAKPAETGEAATSKATGRSSAGPTLARAPGHWSIPAWVAGPPAAIFVLLAGFASCVLSCRWAGDSYNASILI